MDMHIAQDLPLTGIDVYALPPAEGEAVLRRQLAAAYRLVDHFGWTELIYGHLTARVPGDAAALPDQPVRPQLRRGHGLEPGEDRSRRQQRSASPSYPVNYAGFVIHSASTWRTPARHKVVMHTHTRAGMAVCALKEGLLPISMAATAFHGKLAYHDYEGPSLDLDERGRLLANLGDNQAMMLRNHGLLTTGRIVPEAFLRLYRLERACQTQIDAGAAGTLNILGDNLAGKSGADVDGFAEQGDRRHRRPRVRRPDPQDRQDRHELAALERASSPVLRQLVERAQRAAGRLDVGDAPADRCLDQVEGEADRLAQIVEAPRMRWLLCRRPWPRSRVSRYPSPGRR